MASEKYLSTNVLKLYPFGEEYVDSLARLGLIIDAYDDFENVHKGVMEESRFEKQATVFYDQFLVEYGRFKTLERWVKDFNYECSMEKYLTEHNLIGRREHIKDFAKSSSKAMDLREIIEEAHING